jgi:cbb3-type cytochrome oxidase subunit 3
MNRQKTAAFIFNPFSTILLGGAGGLVDNVLHYFLGRGGDVLFCVLLAVVGLMLTPMAREHFAWEKQRAKRKAKPNLGILEWFAIIPGGIMLALGLNQLWVLSVQQFGQPAGTLLFLVCFAFYITLLLFLDVKKNAAEDAAYAAAHPA